MISVTGNHVQQSTMPLASKQMPEARLPTKQDSAPRTVAPDSLETSIKSMQQAISKVNKDVSLEYEKSLDMIKVMIKNGDTQEVIRTIPSEAFIEMKANMNEMIGALLDTTG